MAPDSAGLGETVAVTYRLTHVEPIRGAGRIIAVACAVIEVAGVELLIQGMTVRRRPDGSIETTGPVFRHPATGRWLPAVVLPDELAQALADEIAAALPAWRDRASSARTPSGR